MEIDLTISNYVKNLSDNDMGSLPDAQFRCWVFQTPHKDLGVFQQSLYIYPTFPPIYQVIAVKLLKVTINAPNSTLKLCK